MLICVADIVFSVSMTCAERDGREGTSISTLDVRRDEHALALRATRLCEFRIPKHCAEYSTCLDDIVHIVQFLRRQSHVNKPNHTVSGLSWRRALLTCPIGAGSLRSNATTHTCI